MKKLLHIQKDNLEIYAETTNIEDVAAALYNYRVQEDVVGARVIEFVYEQTFIEWYWQHGTAALYKMRNGRFMYMKKS